ncbi:spore protease YyaC [Chryseomicrobium excrementi]|uniref:Spore protease YyaC n=1 Tax=Chryseomicrobium excrementi TaxID=2041346 RepID=A0A2M9EXZ4_9BACL|nr:spore protease YyaC [Chryseomicrobium excrementi]PJK16068.1 spore protease YyaC [Chryseomicrobium excrementi]
MNPTPYSIHFEQSNGIRQLSSAFLETLPFEDPRLTFICIGTDRSTEDAFGPLTGLFLSLYKSFPLRILGSLDHPVHALNLEDTLENLKQDDATEPTVAIDACLGNLRAIGDILLENGPLWPGKAVHKTLPAVGTYSIKAVVNHGHAEGIETLQTTRLHITHGLARVISNSLFLAWHRYLAKSQMSQPHRVPRPTDLAAN